MWVFYNEDQLRMMAESVRRLIELAVDEGYMPSTELVEFDSSCRRMLNVGDDASEAQVFIFVALAKVTESWFRK